MVNIIHNKKIVQFIPLELKNVDASVKEMFNIEIYKFHIVCKHEKAVLESYFDVPMNTFAIMNYDTITEDTMISVNKERIKHSKYTLIKYLDSNMILMITDEELGNDEKIPINNNVSFDQLSNFILFKVIKEKDIHNKTYIKNVAGHMRVSIKSTESFLNKQKQFYV